MPSTPAEKKRLAAILKMLDQLYPNPQCALDHGSPWQLLVATILSAQCTDQRVNLVTPQVFAKWPAPADMAQAGQEEIEEAIRSTGFFRNKAKSIKGAALAVVENHGGKVPDTLEELVKLPGVGRKTANVVLGNSFGVPGITVDTHVGRISRLLGLTSQKDPVKVEFDLMEIVPKKRWVDFSHQIILHGRAVCKARKPDCPNCRLSPHCPHGKEVTGK